MRIVAEGVENDDLRFGEAFVGDGIADAFVHRGADHFVEIDLLFMESII